MTTVPLRPFCVHLGFRPPPPAISSHSSLQICADMEGMVAGLLWSDSIRPVRPLASSPDGDRNHWRPLRGVLGWERWMEVRIDDRPGAGVKILTLALLMVKKSRHQFSVSLFVNYTHNLCSHLTGTSSANVHLTK